MATIRRRPADSRGLFGVGNGSPHNDRPWPQSRNGRRGGGPLTGTPADLSGFGSRDASVTLAYAAMRRRPQPRRIAKQKGEGPAMPAMGATGLKFGCPKLGAAKL